MITAMATPAPVIHTHGVPLLNQALRFFCFTFTDVYLPES